MRALAFLILASLLSLASCTSAQAAASDKIASKIFDHWHEISRRYVVKHGRPVTPEELMQPVSSLSSWERCIYVFKYTAHSASLDVYPKRPVCGMTTSLHRAEIYAHFLSVLILKQPSYSQEFKSDFHFYLDVGDGLRQSSKAWDLPLPVLAMAKSPLDPHSIPVPDLYQVLGVLAMESTGETQLPSGLTIDWSDGWVEGRSIRTLASMFGFKLPEFDWNEKKGAAIYRGTCYPTDDSYNDDGPPLLPRADLGELCAEVEGKEASERNDMLLPGVPTSLLYDIGLSMPNPETCSKPELKRLCKACEGCKKKESMSIEDMLKYKYQILVDGCSTAWDSSFWKLASGSPTFYLKSRLYNGTAVHPWSMWWYAVLKPGVHFISCTAKDLPLHLLSCMERSDGCQSIGEAAKKVVQESVTVEVTLKYVYYVMKHLSSLALDPKHVT
eukprot:gene14736-20781_t